MNVFEYIASNKPTECYQICERYGIVEIDESQLPEAIAQIVANEGESVFKELINLHPDKEVILELYNPEQRPLQYFTGQQDKEIKAENYTSPNISGVPTQVKFLDNPLSQKYFNLEGSKPVNQTNFFILVGALIVSIAIISAKK